MTETGAQDKNPHWKHAPSDLTYFLSKAPSPTLSRTSVILYSNRNGRLRVREVPTIGDGRINQICLIHMK